MIVAGNVRKPSATSDRAARRATQQLGDSGRRAPTGGRRARPRSARRTRRISSSKASAPRPVSTRWPCSPASSVSSCSSRVLPIPGSPWTATSGVRSVRTASAITRRSCARPARDVIGLPVLLTLAPRGAEDQGFSRVVAAIAIGDSPLQRPGRTPNQSHISRKRSSSCDSRPAAWRSSPPSRSPSPPRWPARRSSTTIPTVAQSAAAPTASTAERRWRARSTRSTGWAAPARCRGSLLPTAQVPIQVPQNSVPLHQGPVHRRDDVLGPAGRAGPLLRPGHDRRRAHVAVGPELPGHRQRRPDALGATPTSGSSASARASTWSRSSSASATRRRR